MTTVPILPPSVSLTHVPSAFAFYAAAHDVPTFPDKITKIESFGLSAMDAYTSLRSRLIFYANLGSISKPVADRLIAEVGAKIEEYQDFPKIDPSFDPFGGA